MPLEAHYQESVFRSSCPGALSEAEILASAAQYFRCRSSPISSLPGQEKAIGQAPSLALRARCGPRSGPYRLGPGPRRLRSGLGVGWECWESVEKLDGAWSSGDNRRPNERGAAGAAGNSDRG